jgi:hypothetical protein
MGGSGLLSFKSVIPLLHHSITPVSTNVGARRLSAPFDDAQGNRVKHMRLFQQPARTADEASI